MKKGKRRLRERGKRRSRRIGRETNGKPRRKRGCKVELKEKRKGKKERKGEEWKEGRERVLKGRERVKVRSTEEERE